MMFSIFSHAGLFVYFRRNINSQHCPLFNWDNCFLLLSWIKIRLNNFVHSHRSWKNSALQERAGHCYLLSALVNSRCFRIGSMEALSWPGRWAGQMCTLYPLSPVSKLWPFFLSVLKLSSLLFLTLSTPILVSQCHLETFLYTVSIQRGRKLEGYLFSDLFKGQGLEDSKSKNKHVLFSYLLYLTLSLVISKAGRSNMDGESKN